MTDQQPPHDDQAEQALLGAMLQSPLAVTAAVTHLNPNHLYRPRHQLIWAAIVETDTWGDPVLLAHELSRRGHLAKIGGTPYLHTCIATAGAGAGPDTIGRYAAIITEHAHTRNRTETALRLRQAATDPDTWAKLLQAAHDDPGHPNGAAGPAPGTLRVTYAADTPPRAATWLWHRRIPLGAITLIGGTGGVGKSTTSYHLLALITRGLLEGELQGQPRNVAIVAAEEAWEEVAVPRLHAAGADLTRAMRIEPITDNQVRGLILPADIPTLTHHLPDLKIAAILIDPIIGAIHTGLDTHKDADVRHALEPLAHMATTTKTTIIATIHLNKGTTTDPARAFMGSAGFVNVSRSALLALPDPEADADGRYLLAHIKSNNGPRQATLAYHLISATIEPVDPDTGAPIETSRVIFDGEDPSGRAAEDILATPRERKDGKLATELLAYITGATPPVPSREIADAFPHVTRNTLDRTLARMVERGKLIRPVHGHYRLPE